MEGLFLGQIVLNAGRITPSGWHVCDGTLLPTMQYAGGAAYIIALEGSYPA
jgi:microcystin-dependent protein